MNRTLLVGIASLALLAPAAAAETRAIEVLLHDRLHIAPETIAANVGDVLELTVRTPADQQGAHDLFLEGYDVHTPMLSPGQSVPLPPLTLDRAGTFAYWCTVPGHREGGMVGTLVVAGAPEGGDAGGASTPAPGALLAALALAGVAIAGAVRRR